MAVTTTTDTGEIIRRIEPALRADPVRNTVFASVRAVLRNKGNGGWCAHDSVALAARSSTEHPIALSDRWRDLPRLSALIGQLPSVVGLGGPVANVDALIGLLDRAPAHRIHERLYRLDRLIAPRRPAGSARPAGRGDIDLVAGWATPYALEAFGHLPAAFDPHSLAESAVEFSRTWLWLDASGVPVSMATRRPPAAGVSRIGPVYTPPAHRGNGYGSAVTARAAFDILDHAAVPVLYTDVSNATSNRIYQAIGFRPVSDRLSVTFG